MIIFYNKTDGKITGTIEGREHPKEHLQAWVGDKKTIGRYIVPFENVIVEEEVPIKELRVVDEKTKRVEEVVVGTEKKKVTRGMKPAVPFADLIYDFESGKKSVHDYHITFDKEGKVKNLEQNK